MNKTITVSIQKMTEVRREQLRAYVVELKKIADDNIEHFGYLYGRWQDEKEYEDIADYGNVMKPKIEAGGFEYVKATKRPFGVVVRKFGAEFALTISSRRYDCKFLREV